MREKTPAKTINDEDFPSLANIGSSVAKKGNFDDTESSRNQSSETPKESDPFSFIQNISELDQMILRRLRSITDAHTSIPA